MKEVEYVTRHEVICDGEALSGHPRIYLHMKQGDNEIVCPYCSKKFIFSAKKRG